MKLEVTRKYGDGFTLVEIMIVVAIIGLLAAIAIPNMVRAREASQLNSIYNNLRIIDGAKAQWALENGQPAGAVAVRADLDPFIKGGTPLDNEIADETYTIGAVSELATADFGGTLADVAGPVSVNGPVVVP